MVECLICQGVVIQVAAQRFDVHASLIWATGPDGTVEGETYDGATFSKPTQPAPTLADRRVALAAERYAREAGGIYFKASGASAPSLVASDETSQAKMTSSYVAALNGHWVDGTPWKASDGSFVPLTSADMQTMALTLLGYVAQCYANEARLLVALEADLTTDITQGWPSNGAAASS